MPVYALGEDPGDGRMVAEFLAAQPLVRPVILHSSNGEAAMRMRGTLELARWRVWRVPPIGEDWIETDWRHAIAEILSPGS